MEIALKMKQKWLSYDLQSAQDISDEALAIDWTLNPRDLQFIFSQGLHSSETLIRFAIHLCWLPKTGRFVQEYSQIPIKAIQYLARQLEREPVLFIRPNCNTILLL